MLMCTTISQFTYQYLVTYTSLDSTRVDHIHVSHFVPLFREKNIYLSGCPFVQGLGQEQKSWDKLFCPGTSLNRKLKIAFFLVKFLTLRCLLFWLMLFPMCMILYSPIVSRPFPFPSPSPPPRWRRFY